MRQIDISSMPKQQGAVLMISLMILLVMTLIGVTAMGTSTMEEKMAGNERDLTLAFHAAEAALRQGEEYVTDNVVSTSAFDGATNGLHAQGSNPDVFAAATWATAIDYAGTIAGVTTAPKYIIEIMQAVGDNDVNINNYGESSGSGQITAFRVTARGTGGSDSAVSMLQSYYGRRF